MSASIVIIDSSDDEDQNNCPSKKQKIEHKNGIKHEDETLGLKIVEITSLAQTNSSCDIIEIDSDDNETAETKTKNGVAKNNENKENEGIINGDTSSIESVSAEGTDNNEDSNEATIMTHENQTNGESSKENNEISTKFEDFLDVCTTNVENAKYKELIELKIGSIKQKFSEADEDYIKSKSFLKLLESNIEKVKTSPVNTIIFFKNIYEELKSRKCHDNIDLNEKQEIYVAKLRKTMRLLDKKIKKLEESEVDFDDDNDSTYIMLERYKKKFVDVHKKYCTYVKEDIYAGRMTYRKLDFSSSDYVDINRAIDRLYMKERKFPLFHEVEACIKKCVKEKGINISDPALDIEIKKMHQEMGKLVQRRRKCELEDIHSYFLGTTIDPASEDSQLKSVLDEQRKKGDQKMEEIFETFTRRQLQGEDPTISPDTDDSNIPSDQDNVEDEVENKA